MHPYPFPQKVLMVTPTFFDVVYSINPYMTDAKGELNKIDFTLAKQQWETLKKIYKNLNFPVFTIEGQPELPDMVFAANQSFPFLDVRTKKPSVLLSEMRSDFRKPEVPFFKKFYEEQGYITHSLKDKSLCFEGNGDILTQPGLGKVWGGYGPRTDQKVYEEMERNFQLEVTPLELISKDFYHLDTCFSILNEETVAIQREAFSRSSLKLIEKAFKNVLSVSYEENLKYFCCNCHSPNGKDVILQKGSKEFKSLLTQSGFNTHEVDTSEFIKAGGSVFCLKMMFF